MVGRTGVRIDTTIDFKSDAGGRDPDTHSATLRCYHRLLWSKPLPDGTEFDLIEAGPYLRDRSGRGALNASLKSNTLSSDYIVSTFSLRKSKAIARVIQQIPAAETIAFRHSVGTIGGKIVWPANQVDHLPTINGAKGFNGKIADRMDLTLECIRRHYLSQRSSGDGADSPLRTVIERYRPFFNLFVDFDGYVAFFLLQDLVTEDGGVKFFTPFDDFNSPSIPTDLATYLEYRRRVVEFIGARNSRIEKWAAKHLTQSLG
jgi:hypothetical protein